MKLETHRVEKPRGCDTLPRPFDADRQRSNWKPARAGDFRYIPASTVPAIGDASCPADVQQSAEAPHDRHDYRRAHEPHHEQAARVAILPTSTHDLAEPETGVPVDGPYFRLALSRYGALALAGTGPVILIPLAGEVSSGLSAAVPGECLVCEDVDRWSASADARVLVARSCSLEH